MLKIILFAALAVTCVQGYLKFFEQCALVTELRNQGFPEDKMRDWVCLVNNESNRYINRISRPYKDGSHDYGLFQINDKHWCSNTSTPGKYCNVTCADLLTDDITKAANCAMKIYKRLGFNVWFSWSICQTASALPDISSCHNSNNSTGV